MKSILNEIISQPLIDSEYLDTFLILKCRVVGYRAGVVKIKYYDGVTDFHMMSQFKSRFESV